MAAAARATAEKKTIGTDRSRSGASPVLQSREHDLDAAAAPVPALAITDGLEPELRNWRCRAGCAWPARQS